MMPDRMILLTAFDGAGEPGRWGELLDEAVANIHKYIDLPIMFGKSDIE